MELAQRDLQLLLIRKRIREKKEGILKKFKEIRKIQSENKEFEKIKNDYQSYFENVSLIKNQQKNALENLLHHLDEITEIATISDEEILEMKKDRKEITDKLNKINNKLNEINK